MKIIVRVRPPLQPQDTQSIVDLISKIIGEKVDCPTSCRRVINTPDVDIDADIYIKADLNSTQKQKLMQILKNKYSNKKIII